VDAAGWFVSGRLGGDRGDKVLNGPVEPRQSVLALCRKDGLGCVGSHAPYAELTFDSKDPLNFLGGTGSTAVGPATTDGAEAITAG